MDAEDARSDLLLAGVVFVIGGVIVDLIRDVIPLGRIPGVAPVLQIGLPLLTTVVVPYLLMRYREEPWAMYGLASSSIGALGTGALFAVPVVIASALVTASQGGGVLQALPLAALGGDEVIGVLRRIAQFGGLALLGAYVTVKARDAFSGVPRTLHTVVIEVARILAIIVVVAGGLLIVRLLVEGTLFGAVAVILPALGAAGMVGLAMRELPRTAATSRPVLVTPTVIFGLAGFFIQFDVVGFVVIVYQAALLATVGLTVGLLQETNRSGFAALGLALVIAVLSTFGQVLR